MIGAAGFMAAPTRQERRQANIDAFYKANGPCCAGCDWWRWHNPLVGECIRSAPVPGAGRFAMLGIQGSSLRPDAGHVMTPREHVCGEFKDGPEAATPSTHKETDKSAPMCQPGMVDSASSLVHSKAAGTHQEPSNG